MKTLHEIEKEIILARLKEMGGNKTKTAESLDITIKTLYNKLWAWGIHLDYAKKESDNRTKETL